MIAKSSADQAWIGGRAGLALRLRRHCEKSIGRAIGIEGKARQFVCTQIMSRR
jgi:hypothetical protein